MHDGAPARLLLVGMMGAGKTTVGRCLAGRLGWELADSDAMVEASTGRTVAQIWEAAGVAAFRTEEKRALAEALTGDRPVVVSVAGGAVLDASNRALMRRSGVVVWLRAAVETLAERVGDGGSHRPLLDGDPLGGLHELDAVRRPLYAAVADIVVDVDQLDAPAVADRVLATMPALPR